jgi:hypothetical protein
MTLANKLAIGAISLATIVGTFTGNKGGFPPFYNKKAGTSYGINVGFFTELQPSSKFYGLNLSALTELDSTDFNGISISGNNMSKRQASLIGLELGLFNSDPRQEDKPIEMHGLQIGIVNTAKPGYFAQIGIGNLVEKDDTTQNHSILLGIGYK